LQRDLALDSLATVAMKRRACVLGAGNDDDDERDRSLGA
jgi:hypothetical protein